MEQTQNLPSNELSNLRPYLVYYLIKKDGTLKKNNTQRKDYVRQYMATSSLDAVQQLQEQINTPFLKLMGVATGNISLPFGEDLMTI